MVKFPTQNKLMYQTGQIGASYARLTSGGTSGVLNLPKDLSMLNRRGYASTTRKGVPLVYKCKVDFYFHDEDGNGPSQSPGSYGADLQATLKIDGCQNNWVMKNAAIKWHAAREAMFKRANIPKKQRGAYSHEIRYAYDAAAQTFLVPIDGDGDAFTGGTWDLSSIVTAADADMELKLVGTAIDEETANTGSAQQIGMSYLYSRQNQQLDTNLESEEGPTDFSILRGLLAQDEVAATRMDDLSAEARDVQDNPPYEVVDISDSGDVNNDVTEPVELGRAIAGSGNGFGSAIVHIPFGLANLRSTFTGTTAITPASGEPKGLVSVEVLDIYDMQG